VQPLTLSAGGGCYPQTATSGSEVLQQALDQMSRAKAEGGNRLYLPG
jgi:GGDEF domain-containing protein